LASSSAIEAAITSSFTITYCFGRHADAIEWALLVGEMGVF
jgi:uncharacterized membrane protein